MPQSTKDSQGGKTHSTTKTHSSGTASGASAAAAAKKPGSRSAKSPVGSSQHGEKKTTPK